MCTTSRRSPSEDAEHQSGFELLAEADPRADHGTLEAHAQAPHQPVVRCRRGGKVGMGRADSAGLDQRRRAGPLPVDEAPAAALPRRGRRSCPRPRRAPRRRRSTRIPDDGDSHSDLGQRLDGRRGRIGFFGGVERGPRRRPRRPRQDRTMASTSPGSLWRRTLAMRSSAITTSASGGENRPPPDGTTA